MPTVSCGGRAGVSVAVVLFGVLWGPWPVLGQATGAEAAGAVEIDSARPTAVSVRWRSSSSDDARVAGLRVWLGEVEPDASCVVAGHPDVLGGTDRDAERVTFRPRLAFRPGLTYTACLSVSDAADGSNRRLWAQRFAVEPEDAEGPREAPRVVSVWPAPGAEIPANALRFYIDFDQPMRAAAVDRAVQLTDAAGRPIDEALVPIPEGLWDTRGRRLTVNLHPGRIKQGVGPREAQGPALEQGATVRLRIGPELRSELGVPVEPATFEYAVGPEDRVPPDPAAWRLAPPSAADAPAMLELDERLDPAILRRAIRVVEAQGSAWINRAVDLQFEDEGRLIRAVPPGGSWQPNSYRLEVLGLVEDLAGNRPGRAFDAVLDPGAPVGGEQREPEWFRFEFVVPAPGGDRMDASGHPLP